MCYIISVPFSRWLLPKREQYCTLCNVTISIRGSKRTYFQKNMPYFHFNNDGWWCQDASMCSQQKNHYFCSLLQTPQPHQTRQSAHRQPGSLKKKDLIWVEHIYIYIDRKGIRIDLPCVINPCIFHLLVSFSRTLHKEESMLNVTLCDLVSVCFASALHPGQKIQQNKAWGALSLLWKTWSRLIQVTALMSYGFERL